MILSKKRVCVCVCVCERERERDKCKILRYAEITENWYKTLFLPAHIAIFTIFAI